MLYYSKSWTLIPLHKKYAFACLHISSQMNPFPLNILYLQYVCLCVDVYSKLVSRPRIKRIWNTFIKFCLYKKTFLQSHTDTHTHIYNDVDDDDDVNVKSNISFNVLKLINSHGRLLMNDTLYKFLLKKDFNSNFLNYNLLKLQNIQQKFHDLRFRSITRIVFVREEEGVGQTK